MILGMIGVGVVAFVFLLFSLYCSEPGSCVSMGGAAY